MKEKLFSALIYLITIVIALSAVKFINEARIRLIIPADIDLDCESILDVVICKFPNK